MSCHPIDGHALDEPERKPRAPKFIVSGFRFPGYSGYKVLYPDKTRLIAPGLLDFEQCRVVAKALNDLDLKRRKKLRKH